MHVVVEPAQVRQFVSQATQVSPVTIVLSVSQVALQVSVRKSNFKFEFHEVQVVVVPEQVKQFASQGTHSPKVVF